jgi:hypothetical protein
MFLVGFTIGSVVPLSVVYVMRPESLNNLVEFFSSGMLITLTWGEGIAHRFNLTHDILSPSVPSTSAKLYSCFTMEWWYQSSTWLIYALFLLSIVLMLIDRRLKSLQCLEQRDDDRVTVDLVLIYFCIVLVAMCAIFVRLFLEYYVFGQCQLWTLIYLLWYLLSFTVVCLWNRTSQ